MNDQDLMTSLKASLDQVHLDLPVARIMARGTHLRAKKQRTWLTAGSLAAAVVVAAAALVGATASSGGTVPGRSHAALTAWTVRGTPDGPVAVTIRALRDLSGLEAQLQADGVSSVVTASMALPPSCTEWHGGDYSTGSIVTLAEESGLPDARGVEFTIDPTAIPQGTLLWLGLAQSGAPAGSTGPAGPISFGLFDDSAACAGTPSG